MKGGKVVLESERGFSNPPEQKVDRSKMDLSTGSNRLARRANKSKKAVTKKLDEYFDWKKCEYKETDLCAFCQKPMSQERSSILELNGKITTRIYLVHEFCLLLAQNTDKSLDETKLKEKPFKVIKTVKTF